LALERMQGKKTVWTGLPAWSRMMLTFVLVLFSWVLFRSQSLDHAFQYMGAMLAVSPAGSASGLLAAQIYTPNSLTMMTLCALLAFHPLEAHDWVDSLSWPRAAVLVPVFVVAIISMFTQAFNPFLYFQF